MKNVRLSLIVAGAIGAFLIAMVGASAHTAGFPFLSMTGVHQTHTDEASGARTEPSEKPEATPTSKPTEKPEPTPTARPSATPEANDNDEDDMVKPTPTTSTTCKSGEDGGDEDGGCKSTGSGGGD